LAKNGTIKNPDIRVESSAPSQKRAAFSVRWAAHILAKEGAKNIVDIGSGKLRNLRIQERNFDEIALVETRKGCEFLRTSVVGKNHLRLLSSEDFLADDAKYDAAFFICVLHIIPSPRLRQKLIRGTAKKIRAGGFIVVDVPQGETYYTRRAEQLPRYRDGYLLRRGDHYTFYKNFHSEELDSMFTKMPGIQLFQKVRYCKHLIRIWRLPSEG
jgi:hypothetical protein